MSVCVRAQGDLCMRSQLCEFMHARMSMRVLTCALVNFIRSCSRTCVCAVVCAQLCV